MLGQYQGARSGGVGITATPTISSIEEMIEDTIRSATYDPLSGKSSDSADVRSFLSNIPRETLARLLPKYQAGKPLYQAQRRQLKAYASENFNPNVDAPTWEYLDPSLEYGFGVIPEALREQYIFENGYYTPKEDYSSEGASAGFLWDPEYRKWLSSDSTRNYRPITGNLSQLSPDEIKDWSNLDYDPKYGLLTTTANTNMRDNANWFDKLVANVIGPAIIGAGVVGAAGAASGLSGAATGVGQSIGMGAADTLGMGSAFTGGGVGSAAGAAAGAASGGLTQAEMLAAQQAGLDTAGWAGAIEPGAIGFTGEFPMSLSQADMLALQQAGIDTSGWGGAISPGAIGFSGLEPGIAEAIAAAGGAGAAGSGGLLSKITAALGGSGGALAGGGGLLGSIAPLLGAVAGAAGPSKQDVKSDSSSVSEPWGPQQEYLKKGFQRADDLYNTGGPQYYQGQQVAGFSPESEQAFQAIRNRATNGSPLIKTAQSELQKTIGGDYLNSNPWLDKNYDFAADALTRNFREAVAPSIDAQFAASGRYGSGMLRNAQDSAQDTLGRNLGGLAANMYGTNYANERNNQLKGMMFAPTMANQDYFDFEQLQGVGNLREQQNQNVINADMNKWNFNQNRPFQNLERYQKSIGGNFGGTSTSTQNQPVTRDRLSGAVGGLLAGSELVKNWGSIFGNK